MTPRKPYPLDSVLEHRKQRVEQQRRELADRVRASELAKQGRMQAEADREAHSETVRATDQAEQQLLERGELRACDLQQGQAWQQAESVVSERLERRVAGTRHQESDAQHAQERARAAAGQAHAEAEALARHRDAFVRGEQKREQDAAEEDALDAHNARRPRRQA